MDALADAWDAVPRGCGVGKTVWFELRLPDDLDVTRPTDVGLFVRGEHEGRGVAVAVDGEGAGR